MDLSNYLALRARLDLLCQTTAERFARHLTCHPGCDSCCRHLSIFAVEAAALAEAMRLLPPHLRELIRHKALAAQEDSPCPLLEKGVCLLYRARPIICRTHGLPLLMERDGKPSVDFCPRNFRGVESIPGSAVIDLERLNTMLAAINALFLQSSPGPERVGMARALAGVTD